MVAGVERVGIGAMVHNHVAHVTAVAAHETLGGLAARHDGHLSHERRDNDIVPELGRQFEQQALMAIHLLPDEQLGLADAGSDEGGNLEGLARNHDVIFGRVLLEPGAHALWPRQQARFEHS